MVNVGLRPRATLPYSGTQRVVRRVKRRALRLVAASALVFLASGGAAHAATLQVSPSGSDSANCASAPCKSLSRAYTVAQPGDVVLMAAGSYGSQSIPELGKTGAVVTFKPASAGGGPQMGDITVKASNVVLSGPINATALSTGNPNGGKRTSNTTVQDISVNVGGTSDTAGYVAWVDGLTWRRIEIYNAREANALLMIDG